MLNKRALRLSHIVVRIVATITLTILGTSVLVDQYSPPYSRVLAHGGLGKVLTAWIIAMSLSLPVYVGFEGWWTHKLNGGSKDLWIDAVLALACFLLFVGIIFYAFKHYAMI